ncbi:3-hydroxy-9,10-secoandrosta-1,3,5(10)-triene-9,17-dione monooxygenase oxygenase subunit [Dactylosporangium sp. NPDC005555]|uniref:3-hydroxy-9,10-secoandrosta-1,3,5(10)-triene-9, 17-dione monooxygenase oxygenase subunit n=1 Tax=Dactylosporangium sp. NPDC005555 TaxID=3154889 RepID=UPI0033AFD099
MSPEDMLDKARALAPALRERAFAAENARRIPDETIAELKAAGLFRMLQPAMYGGFEYDPQTFMEAAMIIGAACPSTGWVFAVVGVHNWQVGLMPQQAQEDVWGAGQDTLISSSYTPRGSVRIVEGGYRISGRWSFSSGSDHCSWVILGGAATEADGTVRRLCFLLPRTDYTVDDVWNVVGLRGTGSNDVVVEDAFVPEHRTHPFTSGSVTSDSPIFALPFGSVFSYGITAPLLGAAQGALDEHISWTAERTRISKGSRVAEEPFSQARVAEAAGELDGARLQMMRNFDEMLTLARDGKELPIELRARCRRDQVRATHLAASAVDRVFTNSGGRVLHERNPIQRAWRDIHAGSLHNSNVAEPILMAYGAHQFGLSIADQGI